jgi:hypothetical protein
MKHADGTGFAVHYFDLPYTLATIAPVLQSSLVAVKCETAHFVLTFVNHVAAEPKI